jgi:hypothetical protein
MVHLFQQMKPIASVARCDKRREYGKWRTHSHDCPKLGVLVTGAVTPTAQAPQSIQIEMLTDWTDLKTTMNKMANEMPEEKFVFKATMAERNYGEQIMHVAQANVGVLRTLGGSAPAPTFDPNATGKAAAIKAVNASFDCGIALLKEQTDSWATRGTSTVRWPFICV